MTFAPSQRGVVSSVTAGPDIGAEVEESCITPNSVITPMQSY